MSYQQSPIATESSEREAVEKSSFKTVPNIVEDGTQLWEDIKAQTGFGSYSDYANTYAEREARSDLDLLKYWLQDTAEDFVNTCFIIDMLAPKDSTPGLSTRCRTSSGLELLAALLQPPEHVRATVVIWDIDRSRFIDRVPEISRGLLNVLGLGLRINPQFFLALVEALRPPQQSHHVMNAVETRPLRSSHVKIGIAVATFVHHYPFDQPATPPIILIAGELDLGEDVSIGDVLGLGQRANFTCIAEQSVYDSPTFTYPSQLSQSASPVTSRRVDLKSAWLRIYKQTFSALALNDPRITSCTATIVTGALVPLLYMDCLKVRAQFLLLRRKFMAFQAAMARNVNSQEEQDETPASIRHDRFWLRRSVEDSENAMSHFERYISAQDADYLCRSSAIFKIKEEMGDIHIEARRLDAEIRDYLQLIVGDLSLEESIRSIELSNQQILEGKRVKICGSMSVCLYLWRAKLEAVTILAFVYIPLNLATSIFGMNLQQLNQNGQNLWVFVTTGVIALFITGVSWLCVEVITSYKGWPRKGSTEDSRRNGRLVFRLALLVWLVKNGHATWMWHSGAWLCILSNDKLGEFHARAHVDLTGQFALTDVRPPSEKACNYVYRSVHSTKLWLNFDLSTIERRGELP